MTRPPRDHRDYAIEILAADEAAALRRLAEVEAERDTYNTYRTMVQVLLEQAHERDALVTRQRDTIRRFFEHERTKPGQRVAV